MSDYSVAMIEARGGLDTLRPIWADLEEDNSSFFLSWGWLETWLATLPEYIGIKAALVKNSGSPIAAFFLGSGRLTRAHCIPTNALSMNSTVCPSCDCLCMEDNGILIRRGTVMECERILDQLSTDWDEIICSGIATESSSGHFIAHPMRKYRVVIEDERAAHYVDLSKVRTVQGDYLSLLGKSTRKNLKESMKYLEARGAIHLATATDRDDAHRFFDKLVELHQSEWERRGEDGSYSHPYMIKFHRQLIDRRFEYGEVQLLQLSLAGEAIGYLYNFVYKNRVFFYSCGFKYDQTNNRYRPGLIAHKEAIEMNAAEGRDVYDFLGGGHRYAANLSTDSRRMVWARIVKPRSSKFLVENTLRAVRRYYLYAGKKTITQ